MKVLSTIIFCCISIALSSQVITGKLTFLKNAEIKLEGFNGLKNYTIATTKTDSAGNFKLSYAANDIGTINGDSLQLKRLFEQLYLLVFYSFFCA